MLTLTSILSSYSYSLTALPYAPPTIYSFPTRRSSYLGSGREMSPDSSERVVTPEEEENLRVFLKSTIPSLADAPIVYTRICMYCDTNDGDFWIASDPERPNLVISTGDGGHGFKFAPVLGA